jgi:hypothetical protein
MSTPTEKPPDHQHPRWLLRAAAWGSALAYGCIFAGANTLAHMRYQVHGWPFVYMVRATHVGGELHNILYGPWPLFSPPLVSFWPMWLLLDVLCGIVLMGLAVAIALYWLRVRRQPLQFGLRNLFLFMTVVACLLGLFKFFNPGFGETFGLWFTIAWCMLLLSQILVYIVPVALVATVAHWVVVRRTDSQRRRPRAGIH